MARSAILDGARHTASRAKGAFGWWGRARTFLAQVKNELDRVTWPSWKEVQATTLVVLMTSVLFGLYLWGADLVFDRVARLLFTTFGAP